MGNGKKKKNKKKDSLVLSRIFKPIKPTPIIVAAVIGIGSALGAGAAGDAVKSKSAVDCGTVVSRAVTEHKAAPTIKYRYSGPAEDECKINEILDELP